MKTFFRNLLPLFAGASLAAGAEISTVGDWVESVDASNLAAGAGSDIQGPLQSVSGVTVLTVSNAPGTWRLRVRRNPGQWNNNLTVWVKRTSDGSGSGTINGGAAYVEIGTTDVEIFSGTQDRGNISLQFKLTGLNRTVSPDTYSSSLIFTVQ